MPHFILFQINYKINRFNKMKRASVLLLSVPTWKKIPSRKASLPSPLSHWKLQPGFLLTFSIIFDINFLHNSQQTAPYFLGCFRVVIELHTWHTREVVKIDEERFEALDELSLSENGLLIAFESRSWELPNSPKLEESWRTGLRRMEDDGDTGGSFLSFDFFEDLWSTSSVKLKAKIWEKLKISFFVCP